jgi:hypothetical protein
LLISYLGFPPLLSPLAHIIPLSTISSMHHAYSSLVSAGVCQEGQDSYSTPWARALMDTNLDHSRSGYREPNNGAPSAFLWRNDLIYTSLLVTGLILGGLGVLRTQTACFVRVCPWANNVASGEACRLSSRRCIDRVGILG